MVGVVKYCGAGTVGALTRVSSRVLVEVLGSTGLEGLGCMGFMELRMAFANFADTSSL